MARYEAGETLASIARTYDCSPPAISYVVSRSRSRHPGPQSPPKPSSATEPQLIKAATGEGATTGTVQPEAHATSPASIVSLPAGGREAGQTPAASAQGSVADSGNRRFEPPPRSNGFAHGADQLRAGPSNAPRPVPQPMQRPPVAPANGDQRRTLHLSLGQNAYGNGAPQSAAGQHTEASDLFDRTHPPHPALHEPKMPHREPEEARSDRSFGVSETQRDAYPASARHNGDPIQRKSEAGLFIDRELRARVDSDIAAFLAAFDAALLQDTQESRTALREATDRLLRAGARTRIELERLEARVPLPAHDRSGHGEPGWRYR